MIRTFIALTLPPSFRPTLTEVSTALQRLPVRWVKAENVHLTLKFLGDVPAERLSAIEHAVARAVQGQAPFTVTARSLGCFPSLSRPRILWMGLDDPAQQVLQLYQRVEHELIATGFSADPRPFRPHVTLARFQPGRRHQPVLPILRPYQEHEFGTLEVTHVHVFQSQLRPEGARYSALFSVSLIE